MIKTLNDFQPKFTIFESDEHGREINIYKFNNVSIVGDSLLYPNPIFYSNNEFIRPINESIMSLIDIPDNSVHENFDLVFKHKVDNPLFFFVYNTENYYHFLYDTLPYLISFFELKKNEPELKLLMSYPNQTKNNHYRFVTEFLELLGITKNDIEIIQNKTIYSTIYVSTSYTHGGKSNTPPRQEIFSFFNSIKESINLNYSTPKKIYVSRRSHIHGDLSNIGTNYTSRRKMVNEDELVDLLIKNGFTEVFTETMSTTDKIIMFANADVVIGAIGGGICNVLFSPNNTKLISIISPYFLNINKRFLFSLQNVDLHIFNDTSHIEESEFKTNMRIKHNDIIGEIYKINDDGTINVNYSNTKIPGWNMDMEYQTITLDAKNCIKLDNGLNSPWSVNIKTFKEKFL